MLGIACASFSAVGFGVCFKLEQLCDVRVGCIRAEVAVSFGLCCLLLMASRFDEREAGVTEMIPCRWVKGQEIWACNLQHHPS